LSFVTLIAVRHPCSCKPRLVHLHTLQETGEERKERNGVKEREGRDERRVVEWSEGVRGEKRTGSREGKREGGNEGSKD
jgi:hypothetical protein